MNRNLLLHLLTSVEPAPHGIVPNPTATEDDTRQTQSWKERVLGLGVLLETMDRPQFRQLYVLVVHQLLVSALADLPMDMQTEAKVFIELMAVVSTPRMMSRSRNWLLRLLTSFAPAPVGDVLSATDTEVDTGRGQSWQDLVTRLGKLLKRVDHKQAVSLHALFQDKEFRDETTITASHESKVGSKDIQSLEETKEEVVALPGDMTVEGWGKITETMGDTPGDYQVDLPEDMSVGGLVATTEAMSEGVLVEGVPLPEPVRRKCSIM